MNSKFVVITGASSGIGYETAKIFASIKKNLILTARREKNLQVLKNEILNSYPEIKIEIKATDLSISENLYNFYDDLKNFEIETWINNAGFGNYGNVSEHNLKKIQNMIHLDVEAVVILSSLFVRDYKNVKGTQLINISSAGGYIIVPNAITYCAAKFFVSSFTEGLAMELKNSGCEMRAKILAPAATETEFGKIANNVEKYDYKKSFSKFHSAKQIAEFLLKLYFSDSTVGIVDRESFEFKLTEPLFAYAGKSEHNQKI